MTTPPTWPRQPFIGLGLSAIAGILLAELWPAPLSGLVLLLIAAIWAWKLRRWELVHLCVTLAFFAGHSLRQTESPGRRFANQLGNEPQALAVQGTVVSEPRISARGTASFQLRLRWYERDGERHPSHARILVRWRGEVQFGDELQLFGVLQPFGGPRNPGEFDMRAYLARRDMRHTLVVRYPENGRHLARGGGSQILRAAQSSRRWMQAALARGLEDSSNLNGLISAMVLGVRDDTADEIEEQFQQTGTIHLFSVSGLHVGIVGYLLWTIARLLRLPRRWAIGLIIPALFFYAAVTGLNTASVRAALMAAFLLGGYLFERRAWPLNSVAAAGLLILAIDSNQLFATGFQLSFAVVLTIILCAERLFQALVRWCEPDAFLPRSLLSLTQKATLSGWQTVSRGASVSLAAWFGSLPLILPYFYLVTPISLLANLVVVPIAFLVLAVGFMSLLTMPIAPALGIIFNNANWSLASTILAAAGLFTQAPAGHFYLELPHRPSGALVELTALDLGAGGALHLRAADADWLIDCGSARDFPRLTRSYLRSRGINRLDGVLLTHGDASHLGAAAAVQRAFRPRLWLDNLAPDRSRVHRDFRDYLQEQQIQPRLLAAPEEWQLSANVCARILYPPRGLQTSSADDQALVVQLEVAERWRILIVSDSGALTERALLDSGVDLASDVLIKGQHHSGISGSAEFLDRVRPRMIVASSPEFPEHERVKEEWAAEVNARGIKLFRQDETGAVALEFHRGRWEAKPFLRGKQGRVVDYGPPVALAR